MKISMGTVTALAEGMVKHLQDSLSRREMREPTAFVGIPRGGIPAAMLLAKAWSDLVDKDVPVFSCDDIPENYLTRIVLVDDIRATGNTLARVVSLLGPSVLAQAVLIHKGLASDVLSGMEVPIGEWVEFPWETRDSDGGRPEDAVRRLIEYLGDDPTREEVLDTPARVLKFYDELRDIQSQEISGATFESDTKDLVVVSGIPFASLCEHHMLPFFGEAAVGYVPNGCILGLSKIARAVQQNAAGLTVQEHLTAQVASQIQKWTKAPDVAVVTTAVHSCMVIRGVKAIGSRTSASAMLGSFRTAPELRAEFFSIVEGARR